jgi:hypothetical protein
MSAARGCAQFVGRRGKSKLERTGTRDVIRPVVPSIIHVSTSYFCVVAQLDNQ